MNRPAWFQVHKCQENLEPEIFKSKFSSWVNTKTPFIPPKLCLDISNDLNVNISALYSPRKSIKAALPIIKDAMAAANSIVKSFSPFIYKKGRFLELKEEIGHFHVKDSYMFLAVYHKTGVDLFTEDPHLSIFDLAKEQKMQGFECVIYIWRGRQSSNLASSIFQLKTYAQMEKVIAEMYGCNITVFHVLQGREPLSLLAHLDNMITLHRGHSSERTEKESDETRLYQIRIDQKYDTARAAEISFENLVFNSCDFYFICDRNQSYLWIGKNADVEQLEYVKDLIFTIDKETDYVIINQEDPDSNWKYQNIPIYNLNIKVTRFLRCSSTRGFFEVEDIPIYTQDDCRSNSIIFFDEGASIYVWKGMDSSAVSNFATQSLNIYLAQKTQATPTIVNVAEGAEPLHFRALFLGWI
jgi:hypothetical protein